MTVHAQHLIEQDEAKSKFLFTKTARKFPIVDVFDAHEILDLREAMIEHANRSNR